MANFKTGVLLQTKSNKDFNLPETYAISIIATKFSIDPRNEYLYTFEEGVQIYTTNPLNKAKTKDYKKEITEIAAGKQFLYLLNDESLTALSTSFFNVVSAEFRDCKLIPMDNNEVSVQNKQELRVFDSSGRRTAVFRCQCSFIDRDILLIGYLSTLKAYIKNKLAFEVSFPAYITCLITDKIFSRIYCSTQDNNIYCYNLDGTALQTLEHHKAPVKQMKLNFCGEYLYTCDGHKMCVWSTKHNVVLGYFESEDLIEDFDTYLVDDFQYNLADILI